MRIGGRESSKILRSIGINGVKIKKQLYIWREPIDIVLVWPLGVQYKYTNDWMTDVPGNMIGTSPKLSA